jgi:hypothetical protein
MNQLEQVRRDARECLPGYHKFWAAGRWGVVFGASRCEHCGKVARPEDINPPQRREPGEQP